MAWDLLGNTRKSDRDYFHADERTIRPDRDACCQKPLTPFEMMKLIENIDKKRRDCGCYKSDNSTVKD